MNPVAVEQSGQRPFDVLRQHNDPLSGTEFDPLEKLGRPLVEPHAGLRLAGRKVQILVEPLVERNLPHDHLLDRIARAAVQRRDDQLPSRRRPDAARPLHVGADILLVLVALVEDADHTDRLKRNLEREIVRKHLPGILELGAEPGHGAPVGLVRDENIVVGLDIPPVAEIPDALNHPRPARLILRRPLFPVPFGQRDGFASRGHELHAAERLPDHALRTVVEPAFFDGEQEQDLPQRISPGREQIGDLMSAVPLLQLVNLRRTAVQ